MPKPRQLSRRHLALLALGAALAGSPAAAGGPAPAPPRTIGFMTDFDVKDDAVAICKAVMERVAPGVHILDITHQIEPYNLRQAARFLAGTAPYFPADAVRVLVVHPGVGPT